LKPLDRQVVFATPREATRVAPGSPTRSLHALWREDPFETCLFVVFLAGLCWTPFWLGGDRPIPWGVNGILFPGLAIACELSMLVRRRKHPVGIEHVALSAVLFIAVAAWIVAQMSTLTPPTTWHPIWDMATDVLEQPLVQSISINRTATMQAFVTLLSDASVFWLAMQLTRKTERAIILLRVVSSAVAGYSLYGLMLSAVYGGGIPFFEVPGAGLLVRSTFVNRNNFATYAGLGLVVTLALILRLYRHESPGDVSLRSYRLRTFIEATGRAGWRLLAAALIITVALLGSGSRGGILASALGVFAVLALSYTRQRRHRGEQAEAIFFVTVALIACFAVFGDLVVGRITSAANDAASRFVVYQIILRALYDAPFVGFGYGAFSDVFPMYRDGSIVAWGVWDKAHNTYLEAALGLGLIGAAALFIALAALFLQCVAGALKRRRNATPAIVGAACSLLVGLHALVDFSLQIEAVTLTYMALLGAGVSGSISSRIATTD
jgi:O-antigen ligase